MFTSDTCPKVSVIIPCYNNGKLLSEMIECIVHQTFTDWELVIVDDRSTDNTPDIVKEYQRRDNRIRLIIRNREPKGSATCRNIGFDNSKGEYIMHFDADDLISSTCLENRVEFMDKNSDVDYASFPAKSFNDSNNLPSFTDSGKTFGVPNKNTDLIRDFLKADYPFSVWNNIYRKDSVSEIRWDENVLIYTDFSYILPCILKGIKHKFSEKAQLDYYYRSTFSNNNMCANFVSDEKCDSTIYLFNKTLESLKKSSCYFKLKNDFLHFIIIHFERLAIDRNNSNIYNYLSFCKRYYSSRVIFNLNVIYRIIRQIRNRKYRLYFTYTLLCISFWHKRYLNIFWKHIK